MIAGVGGGPSARAIMASALSGTALRVNDVVRILDESGQSLQFSTGLLAATLENIDPGVSVVDRDLRLVAWNSRYLNLFRYPHGLVKVGTPVADLIRYNALRGECGPGEVNDHIARRLGHMGRAMTHSFERLRPDGRVLKTVGGPMTGGGYVMCFTDMTAEARGRAALEKARAEWESRVVERTGQLQAANAALGEATAEKTRFLARGREPRSSATAARRAAVCRSAGRRSAGNGAALARQCRSLDRGRRQAAAGAARHFQARWRRHHARADGLCEARPACRACRKLRAAGG